MKRVIERLPGKNDLLQLFLICVFPTHVWAYFIFLHELPAYLLHIKAIEIAGILAYVLSFSLLESLLAFLVLLGLAVIIPHKCFLNRFISQGLILVILTMIWLVILNFLIWNKLLISSTYGKVNQPAIPILVMLGIVWLVTFLAAAGGLSVLLHRSPRLENILLDIAERITVLSVVFLVFDLLSIGLLVVRSFRG